MGAFSYFPHTEEDIRVMLERIGVGSMDDLYADVPADFIYKGEYDLPSAMSEQQVRDFFESLASKNTRLKVFVGQGAYDHYVPSVIPYITSRSEFLTAYTPYQCEISQGTLRYIFEWQSMICRLTGLDCANASMYDGPTAAAEAMRMCVASAKRRNSVLVSARLLPNVIETIQTYAKYAGINVVVSDTVFEDAAEGVLDLAGVIVPSINRFGVIENHLGLADLVHEMGALLVEYCDPSALAVVKSPAEWGADIAVGDGQSLGIPLCFGGPYVGFMACTAALMRKLPGRIVGETTDHLLQRIPDGTLVHRIPVADGSGRHAQGQRPLLRRRALPARRPARHGQVPARLRRRLPQGILPQAALPGPQTPEGPARRRLLRRPADRGRLRDLLRHGKAHP